MTGTVWREGLIWRWRASTGNAMSSGWALFRWWAERRKRAWLRAES